MNDQFKNLFKGIVLILLLVVVLLCLSITFHSCRSQKQATTTVAENVEVAKAASTTTETAARTQWMSSLSIDLDSFELFMPMPFGTDTASSLPAFADPTTSQPRLHAANMVVLKGKRASIGKADLAERNASRCARQVDSVASHRTMEDHYTRDTVGIYKPPNITWWPWAILAALALLVTVRYWIIIGTIIAGF